MARKLSEIARRITVVLVAGTATFSTTSSPAQAETQTTESPVVIQNPFTTAERQPQKKSELQPSTKSQSVSEPQSKPRHPIAYQNPFAAASKTPPVDTSLRPGPISRWRHPVIAGNDSSAVKTALTTVPVPQQFHPSWDVLPPGEDLRSRTLIRAKETDPTFFSRLAASPGAIQFTPKPLTQPTWLTEFDEVLSPDSHPTRVDAALFDAPLHAPGYASQAAAVTPATGIEQAGRATLAILQEADDITLPKADESASMVSNCVETPEGWLEQAQHAAKDANSPDTLSSVVEFCERGLRGSPEQKQSTSLRRLSAWAHNRRGEMLADSDRNDDALSDFQTAISLDPSCSLAIHNRAVTFAQQNQFEAALRDFNRVIELNPGLAVAYRNRAELLAALGRTEEAIGDYSQALESLPNDAHLYRDRANAYQQLGEFSKSATDLDRAIEISHDDPEAITQRGNLAAEQGKYEQAQADFHTALAKDANCAEAHRSLAWLEATCPDVTFRDARAAISAAEWAAKLAPANDYLVLDTLAAAHASAGEFDKAIEFQKQALNGAPPEAVQALRQRLALYQHGQAFRNVAAPVADSTPVSDKPAEANATDDTLR